MVKKYYNKDKKKKYEDEDNYDNDIDKKDKNIKQQEEYEREIEEDEREIEEDDNEEETYGYPKIDDPHLQLKLYKKREFYYYKLQERPELTNYQEIEDYRKKICKPPPGSLLEHQSLLSNFINPDTPYKGLLLFHGTGTGKCKRGIDLEYINGDLIKASEVWEKYRTDIIIDNEGGEWSIPSEKLIINSYNGYKMIGKSVSKLYREHIKSHIREIEFENGAKIGITYAHKLLKKSCNKNNWDNNLRIGDSVCIPRKINNEGRKYNFKLEECYKDGYNFEKSIENMVLHYNTLGVRWFLYGFIEKKAYINTTEREVVINNLNYITVKKLEILFRIIGIVILYKRYGPETNNKYYIKLRNPYLQVLFFEDTLCEYKVDIINTYKFNLIKDITEKLDTEFFLRQEMVNLKIVNIREIEYEGYVYDMEVDTYHNYVSEGILCHNTCAAIAIAEKFKSLVQRYGTKIHILVPGPHLKEKWKKDIISCTGNEYTKENEKTYFINDEELEKNKKQALVNALQFYKIATYKSFYRKVLGEKIVEKKVIENNKIKISYKKTEEGIFERDISIDKLVNLNNTLLIIEEAHNLTGNSWGEAVKKIIENSINLKILLLTATPMKNTADEIIELINFLRPLNSQIQRDLIFTNDKTHLMTLKKGGLEYLKKMARGYVSHLRGGDPITFANKKEMGNKPKGLLFTKIVQCKMDKFQRETYDEALKIIDDSLDRKSEAVANFVFPGISEDKKKLFGLYGREGLNTLKNQLKNHHEKINSLIAKEIYGLDKYKEDYININEQTKNITGAILKKENLSKFSVKFHRSLSDIYENIFYSDNNKESRTSFVYSNLVKVGIELYQEILFINGLLEYDEKKNYQIRDNTICYFCGCENSEHNNYLLKNKNIPEHEFEPATYIAIKGQSNEEVAEIVPENKIKTLDNVFSNIKNKEGKLIKIVLGSKVMNEGISLRNVKSVHILDVYFNFGRVDQVVARAIRWCSHYDLMSKEHPYPEVKLYKYAVTLENNELSTEENLYYKAELKYLLIKKIERGLKEVAIDCGLFREGNVFKDEIKDFNKCKEPNKDLLKIEIKENEQNNYNLCPSKCDFTNCDYKCDDKLLITKYYDPNRNIYKKIEKGNLDYTTFTTKLARGEIEYSKKKILELYMTGYVYKLETIIEYVKESYDENKKELFDNFFVEKALDELIPISENDFNNYKDVIFDKTSRAGYLIYLDGYYIYQPFDENENVTMYYRTHTEHNLLSKLSLYNYINNEKKNLKKDINIKNDINNIEYVYNFDEVMDYYDNRDEFKYVGIIDREINRGKTKLYNEINDIFKLREKRDKILEKKRGTGIPSIKGAVCATSKQKEYLENVAKLLGLKLTSKDITRENICLKIKDKLIEYEKYAKGKDKITYIMIPSNHETLKFPLNIEDRNIYLQNKINQILSSTIKFNLIEKKNNINLSFIANNISKEDIEKIKNLGFESKDNKKWTILID
jgi:hypothetical protein